MKIYKNTIFIHKKNLYSFNIEGYLAVFNPLATKGIVLLDKPSTYIFDCIDGKKSMEDLYSEARKKDSVTQYSEIVKILEYLSTTELIENVLFRSKNNVLKSPSSSRFDVWFHITNQCNLRCTYCFVNKTAENMTYKVGAQILKKLLQDVVKKGLEELHIYFAGGECLLEFPKIEKLVHYGNIIAKRIGVRISYTLITNGVLVTDKVVLFVKKNNIGINISLDGLESYNGERVFSNGIGSSKYVMSSIQKLLDQKIIFGIKMTVTPNNLKHIPQFVKYCLDRGIRLSIGFYNENANAVKENRITDQDKLITYLKRALKYWYDNVPSWRYPIIDYIDPRFPHLRSCGVGRWFSVISHKGDIVACPFTLDKPLGSLINKNAIDTIKEKSFVSSKKLIIEEDTECIKCPWKYICAGGCAFIYKKGKRPIYCKISKAIIPLLLRIEAKRLLTYGG